MCTNLLHLRCCIRVDDDVCCDIIIYYEINISLFNT